MTLSSGIEDAPLPPFARSRGVDPEHQTVWFPRHAAKGWDAPPVSGAAVARRFSAAEAARLRRVIEGAIGDIFGVPQSDLSRASRGKAPVALARQAAMYLAHVACGLSLTEVGLIFARDRTTVAHACAVIEDRRDDPVFDRALELMEWIVPTLVGETPIPTLHAL